MEFIEDLHYAMQAVNQGFSQLNVGPPCRQVNHDDYAFGLNLILVDSYGSDFGASSLYAPVHQIDVSEWDPVEARLYEFHGITNGHLTNGDDVKFANLETLVDKMPKPPKVVKCVGLLPALNHEHDASIGFIPWISGIGRNEKVRFVMQDKYDKRVYNGKDMDGEVHFAQLADEHVIPWNATAFPHEDMLDLSDNYIGRMMIFAYKTSRRRKVKTRALQPLCFDIQLRTANHSPDGSRIGYPLISSDRFVQL